MQYMKYTPVVIALLMTGSVMAQQDKAKSGTAALLKTATVTSEVKVPSAEEIKTFVTEYKDSAESTTTEMFSARFCVPKLTPENKQKHVTAKTAPFQLTIDLYKLQVVDGKKKYVGSVGKGTASFAILDEEGNVVKGMSDDLIKLCSS
jgi:hypothetical protein